MTDITFDNVTFIRNKKTVLHNISMNVASGKLTALVGPNGAGKSTLLGCATGGLAPASGVVTLGSQLISSMSNPEKARHLAYLPQTRPVAWPLLVRDIVAMGRFAFGSGPHHNSATDTKAIDVAINDCNVNHLANRPADTLSGGELARVHLARMFASETPFLLADEPVTGLDPKHQFDIMSLIRKRVDANNGAIVTLHDIALAARFADALVWLKEGKIIAHGPPRETLTVERMRAVFDVNCNISWEGDIPGITVIGRAIQP